MVAFAGAVFRLQPQKSGFDFLRDLQKRDEMDIETARNSVGKMVLSYDAGYKMIYQTFKAHGPYELPQITRAGLAILKGREDIRVPSSLLEEFKEI